MAWLSSRRCSSTCTLQTLPAPSPGVTEALITTLHAPTHDATTRSSVLCAWVLHLHLIVSAPQTLVSSFPPNFYQRKDLHPISRAYHDCQTINCGCALTRSTDSSPTVFTLVSPPTTLLQRSYHLPYPYPASCWDLTTDLICLYQSILPPHSSSALLGLLLMSLDARYLPQLPGLGPST